MGDCMIITAGGMGAMVEDMEEEDYMTITTEEVITGATVGEDCMTTMAGATEEVSCNLFIFIYSTACLIVL